MHIDYGSLDKELTRAEGSSESDHSHSRERFSRNVSLTHKRLFFALLTLLGCVLVVSFTTFGTPKQGNILHTKNTANNSVKKYLSAPFVVIADGADFTNSTEWSLVWHDEFSSPDPHTVADIDGSKWTREIIGGYGTGNDEMEAYTTSLNNSYVLDGHLVIEARRENTTKNSRDYKYTSARLNTEGKFSFTYGRILARMKPPKGQGLWPAFWMLGSSIRTQGWPSCGELDVFELIGGIGRDYSTGEGHVSVSNPQNHCQIMPGDCKVSGTIHWLSCPSQPLPTATTTKGCALGAQTVWAEDTASFMESSPLIDGFNVFALEWEPNEIRWYVNNKLYHSMPIGTKAQTDAGLGAFNQPFYILLNLAVGGVWPGPPDSTTHFPAKLFVDYIRVYQRTET